MIRLSVHYPSGEGTTFDHDYYAASHVPMAAKAFKADTTEIDKGVDGPYVASVHFTFDSMDGFQAAMACPEMPDVMADVANYTNIAPVMQVSEVVG